MVSILIARIAMSGGILRKKAPTWTKCSTELA